MLPVCGDALSCSFGEPKGRGPWTLPVCHVYPGLPGGQMAFGKMQPVGGHARSLLGEPGGKGHGHSGMPHAPWMCHEVKCAWAKWSPSLDKHRGPCLAIPWKPAIHIPGMRPALAICLVVKCPVVTCSVCVAMDSGACFASLCSVSRLAESNEPLWSASRGCCTSKKKHRGHCVQARR